MTNVPIPELNMLKNSSTLAVSVPINPSIKLGFVSVNGPSETYFVDVLDISYSFEESILNTITYLKRHSHLREITDITY